jgi:hypothetical protein
VLCASAKEPVQGDSNQVIVRPEEYPLALRNPHKGFTNRGFRENNRWATLVHHYIPWNEIENREAAVLILGKGGGEGEGRCVSV